ncbi:unnamed protein product [Cuscuta epithymum]|uniref:Aminotransferase-like plant mobile domain-containing protein n=3 Tax=Cuscuta epithymum TaxID=186058 RepID=A0AAV0CSN9_9ASTE|nr:unnamed protein product [Cuscuta epithymum]
MEVIADPGPSDPSVLTLQASHRSEDVWLGMDVQVDRCREHLRGLSHLHVDPRVLAYVRAAGFFTLHRLVATVPLDRALLTALLERWRQETHSFHLPVGEVTVTLGDVAVLTGLEVDGRAVTGTACRQWVDECERLLGIRPVLRADLQGSSLRMPWLREHFQALPPDADEMIIQQHARAYILMMMGASIFADKSGNEVQVLHLPLLERFDVAAQFSWGSATLAYLYRQLCRGCQRGSTELGGFLLLLQIWSWEYIHIGRPIIVGYHGIDGQPLPDEPPRLLGPHHVRGVDPLGRRWLYAGLSRMSSATGLGVYRDALDRMSEDQITWMPYRPDMLAELPPAGREQTHIWRARVPLICFDIVELHLPDRVMRQFGFEQVIPRPIDTYVELHKLDRRGKHTEDWALRHVRYVTMWDRRAELAVAGTPTYVPSVSGDYMGWYYSITRLFVSPSFRLPTHHYQPSSLALHLTTRALQRIHQRATATVTDIPDVDMYGQTLTGIASLCSDVLGRVDYGHLIHMPASQEMASTSSAAAGSSSQTQHERVVLQPRQRRRRRHEQQHLHDEADDGNL